MVSFLLIATFLLVNAIIQIMFKILALGPGGSDYTSLLTDPSFYLCGVLFLAQAALWLSVLRRLPLSKAYPFTSLTIITTIIAGVFFFGESISLGNLIGAFVIIIGVIIIAGDKEIKKKTNPGSI